MKIPKPPMPKPDETDRAIARVRRAMTELAGRIRSDDHAVRVKVARALIRMGESACGPLAVALSRTPDPVHRAYMVVLLRQIGSASDPDVYRVLMRLRKDDPDEAVAVLATEVLSHLLDRRLAAEVRAAREAGEQEAHRGPSRASAG